MSAATRQVCGANRKRGRGLCRVTALYPNGRCRVHGGATPSGPDSAHWKHGRDSKWGGMPKGLAEHYARAAGQSDAALMSLTGEITLLDARVAQLLETTDAGGGPKLWADARTKLVAFRLAVDAKSGVTDAYAALEQAIAAGGQEAQTWASLLEVLDQRRKLVDTESKRRKDAQETVSLRQAMALVSYVAHAIREHVRDAADRARVTMALQKVLRGDVQQGDVIDASAVQS